MYYKFVIYIIFSVIILFDPRVSAGFLKDRFMDSDHSYKPEVKQPKENDKYDSMYRAVSFYKNIEAQGGFIHVPSGKLIKIGSIDKRVPIVARRLKEEGLYDYNVSANNTYNSDIANAI